METHPCAMAINKPLCIGGVERRLLGVALFVSALVATRASYFVALMVFMALVFVMKILTRKDDRILQVGWYWWWQKDHYDPIKRQVFKLTIVEERTDDEE